MDALLPTLYFGRPIVAYNGRFSPSGRSTLMQEHGVTHTFLFPTALKAMMKAVPQPREQLPAAAAGDHERRRGGRRRGVRLLPRRSWAWPSTRCSARPRSTTSSATAHEWAPTAAAAAGRRGRAAWAGPIPGHRVAVIDDDGNECPRGRAGRRRRAPARHPRRSRPGLLPRLLEERRRDARQVHRRQLVPHRRPGAHGRRRLPLVPGPRATTCSRPPATASGRARSRTAWSSIRPWPMPRSCPSPIAERGALVKAFVVLAPRRYDRARRRRCDRAELQRARARQARALRVPEGDRVHRRLPMTTTGKVQRRVLRLREEERAGR